jgi:hypothetical protein
VPEDDVRPFPDIAQFEFRPQLLKACILVRGQPGVQYLAPDAAVEQIANPRFPHPHRASTTAGLSIKIRW